MKILYLFITFLSLLTYNIAISTVQTNTTDIEDTGHCECIKYDCGCCTRLDIPKIDLHSKLCTNFTYLPDEYGISVTVTYNDFDIINETISAKNPPPICSIIFEQVHIHICLRFYNLDYKNKCFYGCAAFEVRVFPLKPRKLKLGCIKQCPFSKKEDSSLILLRKSLEEYMKQPIVIMNHN